MKKSYALVIFFLFVAGLLTSGFLHAMTAYQACGAKPSFLDRMLTDAEKIRIKCIDDYYEKVKEKVRLEVEALHQSHKKLDVELRKVAVKVEVGRVECSPRRGEPERDPRLVKKCQEIVVAQNAILYRIDELMGWNEKPKPPANANTTPNSIVPDCPSKQKLKEMEVTRMFNRKLFETWERCVSLGDPSEYYQ